MVKLVSKGKNLADRVNHARVLLLTLVVQSIRSFTRIKCFTKLAINSRRCI
jgi:hypothetical protein